MPFFIPKDQDFTETQTKNAAVVEGLADLIIRKNPNAFKEHQASPLTLVGMLAQLIVALANKKRLCLDQVKEGTPFFEKLTQFVIKCGMPAALNFLTIENINKDLFNAEGLREINAALADLKKQDLSMMPKSAHEHKATPPAVETKGNVRAAINRIENGTTIPQPPSTSTVNAPANLRLPRNEFKAPSLPLTSIEEPLLETLNKHQYWDNGKPYFPGDVDRALDGYVGQHDSVMVINGIKYSWYRDQFGESRRDSVPGDYENLRREIQNAFRNGKIEQILIPINNGSSHFVFVEIEKMKNGGVEVRLTDSMIENSVSLAHKRNNEILIRSVALALQEAGAQVNVQELYYSEEQGENAKCSYYAVRAMVKACADCGIEPANAHDRLPATGSMKDFEVAMAKKIIRKSTTNRNMPVFKPEELSVDDWGNLCTKDAATAPEYLEAIAFRTRRQFEMKYVDYVKIKALWKELQTLQNTPAVEAWLKNADPGFDKNYALSLSTVIRAVASSNQTALPPELERKRGEIESLRRKITITSYPSHQERFTVDGVLTDPMGMLDRPQHILRSSEAKLELTGEGVTLRLQLVPQLESDEQNELLQKMQTFMNRQLSEWDSELKLANAVAINKNGNELTLVFSAIGYYGEPEYLRNVFFPYALKRLVYDPNTNPDGFFGPSIMREIEYAERSVAPRRARAVEPIRGTIFTVIQDNQATARTQIISRPARSLAEPEPNFLERAQARNEDLEKGRRQLQTWLEGTPPSPTSFIHQPGVTETSTTSLVKLDKPGQVCIKQYFAAIQGYELKQCGVIETCIKPGEQTRLELVLPPKIQLVKQDDSNNFDVLLFDFIHRAVQEALEEQRKEDQSSGVKKEIVIKLDQVTSLSLNIPYKQLALIQYCYFMGYKCQTKHGEKMGETEQKALLDKYDMPTDKSGQYYTAFNRFISHPDIVKRSQPEEPSIQPTPSSPPTPSPTPPPSPFGASQ